VYNLSVLKINAGLFGFLQDEIAVSEMSAWQKLTFGFAAGQR